MIICIGIAVVAAFVLPGIIFLAAFTGILILIRHMDKRRKRKKIPMMNDNKIADVFDILSPIWLAVFRSNSIDESYYYCMDCGTKHKEAACPSCVQSLRKQLNFKSPMSKLYMLVPVLPQCDLFIS